MAAHDDKELERARRKADKLAREQHILTDLGLREVLGSIAGREFVWWLLGVCGVGALPWAETDRETARLIGELNVGQQLLARIAEIDPLAYALMQKEHIERGRPSDTASGSAEPGSDDSSGSGTSTYADA